MSLTAARQVYVMLRDAGPAGVHSLTIRQTGTSGNPSQRLREIAAHGVDVRKRREPVGKRPGIRAWLGEFAPDDAHRVTPDAEVGGETPSGETGSRGAEPQAVLSQSAVDLNAGGRTCRRCDGTGELPSGECVACFGEGRISARRVNSYLEEAA